MLDQDLLPLTNRRARIRPLRHADAEVYAAGTEDPLVRQFAHLPEDRYTSASVRAVIDQVAAPALDRGDLAVLAIADPRTDAFAGSAVVFDVDETRGSAEVGFWVHPAHRGQGLSAAALELSAEFAARSGLTTLTARTVPANTASRIVLGRAGFTEGEACATTAPSGQQVQTVPWSRRLEQTSHLPLVTDRLVLRLHGVDDASALHRIYSRPDVARFQLDEPWTLAGAEEQVASRRRRTGLEGQSGALSAVIEHEDRLIGDVALWWTGRDHRLAEIGWVVDPGQGGRGLATEAVRAMLDLAFERYGAHRVAAQMDARNTASARLAERVGMHREAQLRQDWWSKGEWTDTVIFAMLASDR